MVIDLGVMRRVYGSGPVRARHSGLRRWWDRNRIFIKFLAVAFGCPAALLAFQLVVVPEEGMNNLRIIGIALGIFVVTTVFPLWTVKRYEKRYTMDARGKVTN